MSVVKRCLIISERFYPEEFLVNDLVEEWSRQGHDVEVLTQVPSYPRDRIFDGYENSIFSTSEWNKIPVHRVATILGYSTSVKKKIANYFAFAGLTTCWALKNGGRFDAVFVCHTGPLTMAAAVLPMKWVWRKKVTIWTQDVWPDTVYAYGLRPSGWQRALLEGGVSLVYGSCDTIIGSCSGFRERLARFTRSEVKYVPQWFPIDSPPPQPLPRGGPIIFTFAGNLGSVQNLERLVHVFGRLRLENCELRLVGDGVMHQRLEEIVTTEGYKNVKLLGRLPMKRMPEIFAQSHVLVISLKSEPIFSLTIPAKFQAYLTSGRALFVVAEGELSAIVRTNQLGVVADPEDEESIREGFEKFALPADFDFLSSCGERAYRLSQTEFGRERLIGELSELSLP